MVLPEVLSESLLSPHSTPAGESRARTLPGGAGVTRREFEIIDLIDAGLSTVEIAGRLDISSYTVKSHVRNIMAKLSVHSRVQIAAFTHPARAS